MQPVGVIVSGVVYEYVELNKDENMITLDKICKVFRTEEVETHALHNVSFTVDEGEFVSIMGPSGCGKSTCLNIIGLLDEPTSGKLYINGTDVSGMRDKELARFRNRNLGFVFQNFHLIPSLDVYDNVMLPLTYRRGMPMGEKRERVLSGLERVGLSHRMRHYPSQLSGGQCQRVAIARALVGSPSLLLADEPTGNLDSKMGNDIMELLLALNCEGMTIIMVTHDALLAARTHRIIRFVDGEVVRDE